MTPPSKENRVSHKLTIGESALVKGQYSQVDWSKVSELKARWKLLIEDNRDRIRAGQLFKIAEPPLTPDLFPRGFRFQRKNKTSWPEWPKDITTRKSKGERHETGTRRYYYPEFGYGAYYPYVYAGFDEFLWHPGSGDYKVLWKKTFEFNVAQT